MFIRKDIASAILGDKVVLPIMSISPYSLIENLIVKMSKQPIAASQARMRLYLQHFAVFSALSNIGRALATGIGWMVPSCVLFSTSGMR